MQRIIKPAKISPRESVVSNDAPAGNYKLLRATSHEALSKSIQKELESGWELYGDPFGLVTENATLMFQAVVRRGDNSLQIRSHKLEGVRVLQSRLLTAAGGHNLSSTEILNVVLATEKELDDNPSGGNP